MADKMYGEETQVDGCVSSYIDDAGYMKTTKSDDTRWSRPKTGFFDDRVSDIGSYLDVSEKDAQRNKVTKYSDSTKFGSQKEFYNDSVVNKFAQSYLDTHERDAQRNKVTKYSDSTRFGSQKEFYNDKVNEYGMSYLHKQEAAKLEHAKKEAELKQQTLSKFQKQYLDPEENIFPYAELKGKNCPPGVDPTIKELYLSDEEFEKVFAINYDDFCAMSKHKRITLKKKVELF